MFKAAATVFTVNEMDASLAYYRDALGFSVEFEYGAPASYACLSRGGVSLHLIVAKATKRRPGQGAICIFVDDVDAVHAEIEARGARVIKAPASYDYGMRDFDAVDLDGNHLTFGTATQASPDRSSFRINRVGFLPAPQFARFRPIAGA